MNLVSAKCPNCGASLKLSKEDEKVECEYCHNTIVVEEAIACYKIKVSGTISVEGITTNADLIESANELLGMNEYLKAKRQFLEFSEKCPDNYQGWLGLLICRTRNFTIKDNNIMFENDVNKYYDHFMRVAPEDVKEQYFETIDRYFHPEKYKLTDKVENIEKMKNDVLNNPTVKTITEKAKEGNFTLSKIGIGFLYFLGGVFALGGLVNPAYPFGERILTILVGLSLFPFVYDYLEKKFQIPKKTLKILRIVLPIVLLIMVVTIYPSPPDSNSTSDSNVVEKSNS